MKKLLAILCWLALALDAKSATTYGLTLDGANRYWSPMGGQTPWLQAINGAGFPLTNAGALEVVGPGIGINVTDATFASAFNALQYIHGANSTVTDTGAGYVQAAGQLITFNADATLLDPTTFNYVYGVATAVNVIGQSLALGVYGNDVIITTTNANIFSLYGYKVYVKGDTKSIPMNDYWSFKSSEEIDIKQQLDQFYGFGVGAPVLETNRVSFAFWAGDFSGVGSTNKYYEWADSRGVRRVREDSTFNSVGQAIEALYNPQFTKYTPGAANHERVVLGQWNGNVAEIGTEKGGTGTLRPLRLIGAGVNVSTNLDVYSLSTTNGIASYSSNKLASTSITVGASPFLWTNSLTKNVVVYVDGVSVTGTVGRNGSTVFGTIGQNTVILQPGEWATISYTLGSPTATFHPF